MTLQKEKNIILGMPADNAIFKMVEAGLKYHGFNVINAVLNNQEFRYPSLTSRLKIKIRQLILQDKNAKQKLKSNLLLQSIQQQLQQTDKADYALFIRGDIYTPEFLRIIKQHVRHSMVNYQWDGMNRYPDIQSCIDLFDQFYVFDPSDLNNHTHHFLPTTNFYFDHNIHLPKTAPNDLYFVGFHMPDRVQSIVAFSKFAQKMDWKLDFHIGCLNIDEQNLRNQYPENIQTFIGIRSFEDNIKAAQQAKILVDFKTPIHNGLSFRPFEAIGYRKKLITTNAEIKKYDFYHPDNIFVWDGECLDGLAAFMDTPYQELAPEIYEKYSFGNWIRYILNIQPHIPISLPQA